jgi:hypothetical protein
MHNLTLNYRKMAWKERGGTARLSMKTLPMSSGTSDIQACLCYPKCILNWLLLVAVTGWYRTKRPMQMQPFLIHCAPHISSNHSRFINQSSPLWLEQTHLITKQGETGWEMPVNFSCKYLCPYLYGSFSLLLFSIVKIGLQQFSWTTDTWVIR